MAKKKPTPKKKPSQKSAPKNTPRLGNEAIGEAAGAVWKSLTDEGPQTAAALKKAIDLPGDIVMAAIGWLAREDKLEFASSGRTVKIALR